jgi:hypothetical protein
MAAPGAVEQFFRAASESAVRPAGCELSDLRGALPADLPQEAKRDSDLVGIACGINSTWDSEDVCTFARNSLTLDTGCHRLRYFGAS